MLVNGLSRLLAIKCLQQEQGGLTTIGRSAVKKYNLHINSHLQQEADGQLNSA
jgi:hypothetical protein